MYTHTSYRLQMETWVGTRFAVSTVQILTNTNGRESFHRLRMDYCSEAQLWEYVGYHLTLIRKLLREDQEKREYQPDLVRLPGKEDKRQEKSEPRAGTQQELERPSS